MLGFSSTSELALSQLPSTFAHFSGVSANAVVDTNNPEVNADANVLASDLGSVSATITLGDLASVIGAANISITGLSAIGELGNETVWGLIIPDVGNTYTNITTGASQTWTEITTGASQTWTDVIR